MSKKKKLDEPLSMWPLDPENSLRAFLEVDAEAVKKAERKEKSKRKRARARTAKKAKRGKK